MVTYFLMRIMRHPLIWSNMLITTNAWPRNCNRRGVDIVKSRMEEL